MLGWGYENVCKLYWEGLLFMSIFKLIFYNVYYLLIGVFVSFIFGYKGVKGGFGLELGKFVD